MSEKSIRYLVYGLKAGLFILPILSLIVAGSFFFPFITGKNFFFRIMVEVLFFLWVFVACFDKKYRPTKSPVLIALAATLFFLTLATIFGVNPYRSFWSNFERMEGLVGHIHLFAYFLVLASILRKEKDWKWFFTSLLGVSFVLTVYGFLQHFGVLAIHQGSTRLDATLGNATYYAIFMIFHLFIVSLLFYWSKNKWIRSGLAVLFALDVLLVFLTATRGAILGLFGGSLIFALLMLFFNFKKKKVRYAALGILGALVLTLALFLLLKNTSFVQKNSALSRLASISFTETTVESRFTIWKMATKGFLERPFLGWGPENFNLVFNKYFEPKLWPQEPWFDRAHNIIFDWLISGGILGFLAYWSIWAAAIYIIIKAYKKKLFSPVETSLVFALFAAYAFHNIFVFDNLTSYFLFFSVLGYLHFKHGEIGESGRVLSEEAPFGKRPAKEIKEIGALSYLTITLAFVGVVFSLYFINIKPILAGRQLITTLGEMQAKGANVNFMLGEFDKVFSYNTFGSLEAREQLGSYAGQVFSVQGISQEDKNKALSKAIEEMEKQVVVLPNDARAYVFLATLYTKAGRLNEAMKTGIRAVELSPNKQQIRFVLADVYLSSGQYDKAVEVLKAAYDLDRTYSEAAKNLLIATILQNKPGEADKLSDEFTKTLGPGFANDMRFVNVYAKVGNYQRVKEIWLVAVAQDPNNAQLHVSLAATYFQLGDKENTIKELEKAAELNPDFKQQAESYINEIKAGRNP